MKVFKPFLDHDFFEVHRFTGSIFHTRSPPAASYLMYVYMYVCIKYLYRYACICVLYKMHIEIDIIMHDVSQKVESFLCDVC